MAIDNRQSVHPWQLQEISLRAERSYDNPYADVQLWIDLTGPNFSKRIYGFWDGDNLFKIRFVVTAPGEWRWTTGSNQPDDTGLNSRQGSLVAVAWTEDEKQANPNRRGFVRVTSNGRALQYADGTPFFLVGDTWLAASGWRLPLTGVQPRDDYLPAEGISWEQAVHFRKRQGYNSVSFIAAFPNWFADKHSHNRADESGLFLRNAWEKFGVLALDGSPTAKDMHDEHGNIPFPMHPTREGLSDFDRLNPAYFQSLDRKMIHLAEHGFVPVFEPVRRDACPPWKAYFDFDHSYARFIQCLVARYGCFNMIFSGIHLDWITPKYGLPAEDFNRALTHHHKLYGPLPFGQPVTALIDGSTHISFGHADQCPWLTLHNAGMRMRNHGIYEYFDQLFRLDPPCPAINLEPYYTGWQHKLNRPGRKNPPPNSDRDNYFARAMMYGSVLSGALAGHVHGTAGYDMTSTGEPPGQRPYFWDALNYTSGSYMQHLRDFILSEGPRYQHLLPCSDDLRRRKAWRSRLQRLDGWSYMMRTADKTFALLYFEHQSRPRKIKNLTPRTAYVWTWFDPRSGRWLAPVTVGANRFGTLRIPAFPRAPRLPNHDWAAKLTLAS